jgi:3-oxoacyl-[acyl-carrier-protein] synthase-3
MERSGHGQVPPRGASSCATTRFTSATMPRPTVRAGYPPTQLTAEAIRRLRPYGLFSGGYRVLSCGTSLTRSCLDTAPWSMVNWEPLQVVHGRHLHLGMTAQIRLHACGMGLSLQRRGGRLRNRFHLHATQPCGGIDGQGRRPCEPACLSFDADFCAGCSRRAGAAFLSDRPAPEGRSLRIDWIDVLLCTRA